MESMAIFSNIELLQNLNIQFYLKLHELSELVLLLKLNNR